MKQSTKTTLNGIVFMLITAMVMFFTIRSIAFPEMNKNIKDKMFTTNPQQGIK